MKKAVFGRLPYRIQLITEQLVRQQRILLFTLLSLLPFLIHGQGRDRNHLISRYTLEQGLSDNHVTALLQDSLGYLWIGTLDGLNRFDGIEFTTFKHQPGIANSISSNRITALAEDKNGKLWIATGEGLNCFDPESGRFQNFLHQPEEPGSISHDFVRTLFFDSDGVLWLGTYNGLNRYNEENNTFSHFLHQSTVVRPWETRPAHEVSALGETADGQLLVGYWGTGLMRFDKKSHQFEQVFVNDLPDQGAGLTIDDIQTDPQGNVMVIATGHLFEYHAESLSKIRVKNFSSEEAWGTFSINASGTYLLGGLNGLTILDQDHYQTKLFLPATAEEGDKGYNHVLAVTEDRAGDIWLGTSGGGLYHLNADGKHFSSFTYQKGGNPGVRQNFVNALVEAEPDVVWVGTRRKGISIYNGNNQSFQPLPKAIDYPKGINTNEISVLYKDRAKNIWIGTWGGGVNVYHPGDGRFRYFMKQDFHDENSLLDDYVTDILETQEGEIWVGTVLGLCVLPTSKDIEEGRFKRYKTLPGEEPGLSHFRVLCIYQCTDGQILVGTTKGLLLYQRDSDDFLLLESEPGNNHALSNNRVQCIFEDRNKRIWLGTAGGLNQLNLKEQRFSCFTEKDGLFDGNIAGIVEDRKGHLWVATKKGIARFDPLSSSFKYYDRSDGLLNSIFNPGAFIRSSHSGRVYAGGAEGLTIFQPDSIAPNPFVPPVIITAVKKLNLQSGRSDLTALDRMTGLKQVDLNYQEHVVTFQLAALNFRNASRNQFAYKLEGFSNTWIDIGAKREITFTGLAPGKYRLKVKGSNNDGLWNERPATLSLVVHPPWWATVWAYMAYFFLLLGVTFVVVSFLRKRWQLKEKLKKEQEEAARLKELDLFKSRLYTNLTHEFRTPLTVILGMVGQVRKEPKKLLDQGLRLIETHSHNLLRLINQLLDLSRLENHTFQLQLQNGDIVPYLRYITQSFQTYANGKNLSLRFFTTFESLTMDFDQEQLKQVMVNLISNALKFTPSGGEVKVSLRVEEQQLHIAVKDTGIGIPEKELPLIFDRFYQVDGSTTRKGEGNGIGLAHTQELVKLMGGKIKAESALARGSCFTVSLPIRQQSPPAEVPDPASFEAVGFNSAALSPAPNEFPEKKTDDLPQLLIIEDNPDMVFYLNSCLEGLYRIDVAYNGKIGIEKALEHIPDLIVSDVMMPEKDGYEVCHILKKDERTSHIPIILLTAKADTTSKLTGLKTGADAYLAKPFDKDELLIRLDRLVERQKRMAAYFSEKIRPEKASTARQKEESPEEFIKIEDAFIQKVRRLVEEHYTDENFALPELCDLMNMSRSQLYRKMKALIGASPSSYIRSYRLNEAKKMLQNTDMTISQVAYRVGYKDLGHFSRNFQEEFGVVPSVINK